MLPVASKAQWLARAAGMGKSIAGMAILDRASILHKRCGRRTNGQKYMDLTTLHGTICAVNDDLHSDYNTPYASCQTIFEGFYNRDMAEFSVPAGYP